MLSFFLKYRHPSGLVFCKLRFLVSKEVTCWAVAVLEITDDVKMW